MAKALGADIIEFYDKHWPEGFYHDDNSLVFHSDDQGTWLLEPTETYDLDECGVLVNEKTGNTTDFESVFSKWKKSVDYKTLVIRVPKATSIASIKLLLKKWDCLIEH